MKPLAALLLAVLVAGCDALKIDACANQCRNSNGRMTEAIDGSCKCEYPK